MNDFNGLYGTSVDKVGEGIRGYNLSSVLSPALPTGMRFGEGEMCPRRRPVFVKASETGHRSVRSRSQGFPQ